MSKVFEHMKPLLIEFTVANNKLAEFSKCLRGIGLDTLAIDSLVDKTTQMINMPDNMDHLIEFHFKTLQDDFRTWRTMLNEFENLMAKYNHVGLNGIVENMNSHFMDHRRLLAVVVMEITEYKENM